MFELIRWLVNRAGLTQIILLKLLFLIPPKYLLICQDFHQMIDLKTLGHHLIIWHAWQNIYFWIFKAVRCTFRIQFLLQSGHCLERCCIATCSYCLVIEWICVLHLFWTSLSVLLQILLMTFASDVVCSLKYTWITAWCVMNCIHFYNWLDMFDQWVGQWDERLSNFDNHSAKLQ